MGGEEVSTSVLQDLVDPKNPALLEKLGGVEALGAKLNTDLDNGLSTKQVAINREKYGKNELPEPEIKTLMELVMDGFEDKTLQMLSVSAIVSLVLGLRENPSTGWIEGTAILIAVFIVVFVTAANDYEKEKQFRALNAKKDAREIKVVRDGQQQQIMIDQLVVGDVVSVETGDILPADGVLIIGSNIECDESAATGESDMVKKGYTAKHDPFFISGAQVMDGIGRMVVIAVGENSFNGKQMMGLRVETEDTPLQAKLTDLADDIGYFGLIMAVITVSCLFIREVYHYVSTDRSIDAAFFSAIVRFIITGISILVVAIPEQADPTLQGLPLAVTMALAYSTIKMLEDNNLVRRLEACETMGGATTICSDKTGTLTQNKMEVVKGYVTRMHFDLENTRETPYNKRDVSQEVLNTITQGIAVNSTAYRPEGSRQYVGNKTEGALLAWAEKLGGDYRKQRQEADIVQVYPFSSARKRMSSLVRMSNGKMRLYMKGAAEMMLELCDRQLTKDNEVVPLTATDRESDEKEIFEMAKQALRNIAICYTDLDDDPNRDWETPKPDETEKFILIGFVGIEDPVRPEVPEAVRMCQQAGIKVRMVTGDNAVTAKNIAQKCGIYHPDQGGLVMEGPEFRKLKDKEHELNAAIFKLDVLARSSPLDKQILVDALKKQHEVVAVTGDGTNDGPALKLAHVGFSMGITGTEVAKEASDIVLMDDNFSSIVKAVSWGRNVYDSIRKFIQFQLTVNIVAVVLAFVGSLTDAEGESPLRPVQLLWVNLIMDTMAALALATERPSPALLERPPYGKNAPLISAMMWKNILGQAAFQFVVNFFCLYRPDAIFGGAEDGSSLTEKKNELVHLTLFFNTFVMCQLFNEVNSRKIHGELNVFHGFFNSPLFLAVMTFTLLMQYVIVQFGGEWVGCVPLSYDQWVRCIFIGAMGVPVGVFLRLLPTVSMPQRVTKAPRNRWQKAISQTQKQLSVVERFRRKHSVEHHVRRKHSVD